MTYKTGSIGEFMKWTKRVVTDPAAAANMPKRWFDSDETAAHALRLAGFGGGDDQTALGGKSRSSASDRRAPTGLRARACRACAS